MAAKDHLIDVIQKNANGNVFFYENGAATDANFVSYMSPLSYVDQNERKEDSLKIIDKTRGGDKRLNLQANKPYAFLDENGAPIAGLPIIPTAEELENILGLYFFFKPLSGGGGTDTNFANTNLLLDDNRLHDFNNKYMLLNSVGFTDPASVQPSFVLDPTGGLFGTSVIGFKSGLLGGVNTSLLQQDDGGGLKTVISTQDPASDLHFLQVTQSGVFISAANGGDENSITVDKTDGIEIKVENGNLTLDIPSADTVGKALVLVNTTTKEAQFVDISSLVNNTIFVEQDETDSTTNAIYSTRHTFSGLLSVGTYEISFFTVMEPNGNQTSALLNAIRINNNIEYERGYTCFFGNEGFFDNTFIYQVATAGSFDIEGQFRRFTAGTTARCLFSNMIIKKIL